MTHEVDHDLQSNLFEDIFQAERLQQAFSRLGGQAWVDKVRVIDGGGRLDIDATAASIGAVVYRVSELNGEPFDPDGQVDLTVPDNELIPVYLNNKCERKHRFVAGHEFGHIFLRKIALVKRTIFNVDRIEPFCDLVGRQMAVPLEQLADVEKVDTALIKELSARFDTPPIPIIYQLMQAGALPRRAYIDFAYNDPGLRNLHGKKQRELICLDCENHDSHSTENNDGPIPSLDLSSFDWRVASDMNATCILGGLG